MFDPSMYDSALSNGLQTFIASQFDSLIRAVKGAHAYRTAFVGLDSALRNERSRIQVLASAEHPFARGAKRCRIRWI